MTSKLKTDVLETVSGSGTIALTNQLSGMTTASLPTLTSAEMPAGSVINTQHYPIGTYTTSAGVLSEVFTISFTKSEASSYLIISLDFGYSSPTFTSSDTNQRMRLKNKTSNTELKSSTFSSYSGDTGTFFDTDTNNLYGVAINSAAYFNYHTFNISTVLKDTSAGAGANTFGFTQYAQNSSIQINKWQQGSILIQEIKG